MGNASISRRSGTKQATINFENYGQPTKVSDLSAPRYNLAATTVDGYALFGGGSSSPNNSDAVDAYDVNLSRSTPQALSVARYNLAATTIGKYALFGGGFGSAGTTISAGITTVDYYEYGPKGLELTLYKGTKYKFQNMSNEMEVTSEISTISIPTPATGYIKFKNATL